EGAFEVSHGPEDDRSRHPGIVQRLGRHASRHRDLQEPVAPTRERQSRQKDHRRRAVPLHDAILRRAVQKVTRKETSTFAIGGSTVCPPNSGSQMFPPYGRSSPFSFSSQRVARLRPATLTEAPEAPIREARRG